MKSNVGTSFVNVRMAVGFLLCAWIVVPAPGQSNGRYRNELAEFEYPAGWEAREIAGPLAVSVEFKPRADQQWLFYVGVQAVDAGIDEKIAHEQKISQYLAANRGWRQEGDSVSRDRPAGRELMTVLVDAAGNRQVISTVLSSGAFVLIAGAVGYDRELQGREAILNSLSLGAPGKLRLNRPDPTAAAPMLIGSWQDRGTTLTFGEDGSAISEMHLPGIRSQQWREPLSGRYQVERGVLVINWDKSGELPARQENCVFGASGADLRMLCRGYGDEATYVRPPDTERSNLTGLVANVLISAAVLMILVSLTLLVIFKWAISRLMKRPSGDGAPDDSAARELRLEQQQPPYVGLDRPLLTLASEARSRLKAGYAVAGLCASALFTLAYLLEAGSVTLLRYVCLFPVFAWPVLLTSRQIVSYRNYTMATAIGYPMLLLGMGLIGRLTNAEFEIWHIGLLWLAANAGPTLLVLALANGSLRSIGPAIFSLAAIAMGLIWGLVHVAATNVSAGRVLSGLTGIIGLSPESGALSVFLIGLLLAIPVMYMTLITIAGAYDRRRFSEQSLAIDAVWFLFVIGHFTILAVDGAISYGALCTALALPAYLVVKTAALKRVRLRSAFSQSGPSLLVLRVFSLGRHSQRVFDVLGGLWRFVGPVRLIGAPDFASRLIQPSTVLKFLGGRLASLFIGSPTALVLRLEALKEVPDVDGRFRLNEFFCYQNTWLNTVAELARRSDAIVMDFRKFTGENQGAKQEIETLLNTVPAKKIMVLTDSDSEYLRAVIADAWTRLSPDSPNFGATKGMLQQFQLDSSNPRDLENACRVVFGLVRAQ